MNEKPILVVTGLDFGRVWGPLGRLLAVTWLAFGRSGAALGLSWPLLGELLGTSWAFLAISWLVWGASWVHFGSRTRPSRRFYQVWGWAGLGFGTLRGHVLPCLLLCLALHNFLFFSAKTPRTRLRAYKKGPAECAERLNKFLFYFEGNVSATGDALFEGK